VIKREATDFVDDHSLNKLVAADYDVMPPYCHSGRSGVETRNPGELFQFLFLT